MAESLSSIERALLRVFRQKGVRAGMVVPESVLREGVVFSGGAPVQTGAIETALLNLQFRGMIVPGPDPFSATSWTLTELGEEIVAHQLDVTA